MPLHLDMDPNLTALEAASALRHRVFVDEQGVDPAIERDGRDEEALHVVVHAPAGSVVATGRILVRAGVAKVQRVAVAPERRGTGLGRLVMDGLEARAAAEGARELRLSSQQEAIGFYERLGYEGQGELYLEAGIVHLAMSKPLGGAP